MAWSPQQEDALKAVKNWLDNPQGKQVFRLFGYAGTGKTTLAKSLAEDVTGKVMFGAFTGKAALVMRSKGCEGASTIHSMIYKLIDDEGGLPRFILNEDGEIGDADLIVIDECSMVGAELAEDLLSFGVPVLVLGDPAQLPPVQDAGYFTNGEPDVLLTEVHRQARDNPIIAMSMAIREGRPLDRGTYGDSRVISTREVDRAEVLKADQVLVGKNMTRRSYNERIRTLKGFSGSTPVPGERLVCLRNNRPKKLLNGSLWKVREITDAMSTGVKLIVTSEDGSSGTDAHVYVMREFFAGVEDSIPWEKRRQSDEFTYGYALTVHKAQGSQWPNVYLFDESSTFREDGRRWLYTAITRAAERVTVAQ